MPKRPSVRSTPYYGDTTATAPDILARAPARGDRQRLIDAIAEAVGKTVRAALHQEMLQFTTEFRRATRSKRHDSIDPRKMKIAGVVKSRPPYPKMTVAEIFREMDRLQERYPKDESYRPLLAWKVRCWSEMEGDNRALAYIAKIRADPRYLPPEYLTTRGKERFTMNRG